MKKRNFLTRFVALLIPCISIYSQGLEVGQKMPPLLLYDIYNAPYSTMNLDTVKTKLIILDFWGTNCIGCIQSFSKIDSLQKQFKSDLVIIMVNSESKDSTQRFFEKRKLVKRPAVLFATADTLLTGYFPHDGFPHYVWLDGNLVVKAFASGNDMNAAQIESFLNEKNIHFQKPESGRTTVPSIINLDYEEKLACYSIISHCIKGNQKDISDSLRSRFSILSKKCASPLALYKMAFTGNNDYNFDRIGRLILDVKDSSLYIPPADKSLSQAWAARHAYNYQLLLPREKDEQKFTIMKQDLQRFFGLNARIEKRSTKCYVLLATDTNKLKTKGGAPVNNFRRSDIDGDWYDAYRTLKNMPFTIFSHSLLFWLEKKYHLPFEDATGFLGNIDISIPGQIVEELDLKKLNNELAKVGLMVVFKKHDLDVLVITD